MAINPQSYVQPTAQGNVPFLSNNGNPNIVYNQPGVGGGYVPPMFGNDGIWRVNPVPQRTPFWQQPRGPGFNFGGGFPIPQWTPTGAVIPGVVQPPAALPPVTGGPLPPVQLQQPVARQVLDLRKEGGSLGPGPWGGQNEWNGGVNTFGYGDGYGQPGGGSGGGFNLSGMGDGLRGMWDNAVGSVKGIFTGANSQSPWDTSTRGFNWGSTADALSEPWVPGNLYNDNTGKWDKAAIAEGLIQRLTGINVGGIAAKLGEQQYRQDDPKNWLEKFLVGRYEASLPPTYVASPNNVITGQPNANWLGEGFYLPGTSGGGVGFGYGQTNPWTAQGNGGPFSPFGQWSSPGVSGLSNFGLPSSGPAAGNPWGGALQSIFGPTTPVSSTPADAAASGGDSGGGGGGASGGGGGKFAGASGTSGSAATGTRIRGNPFFAY